MVTNFWLIFQDEVWSKDTDPKLQSLLTELELSLGASLRKSLNGKAKVNDKTDSLAGKGFNLINVFKFCQKLPFVLNLGKF